jgi:hypothetical protein
VSKRGKKFVLPPVRFSQPISDLSLERYVCVNADRAAGFARVIFLNYPAPIENPDPAAIFGAQSMFGLV